MSEWRCDRCDRVGCYQGHYRTHAGDDRWHMCCPDPPGCELDSGDPRGRPVWTDAPAEDAR